MATKVKKAVTVKAEPNARRGPLAHSGNGYAPALAFIATLKGKARSYAEAQFRFITRGGNAPVAECTPEQAKGVQQSLFDLFATEAP